MTNTAGSSTHYIDTAAFDAIMARWLSLPIINKAQLTNTITADYFYPLARNIVPAKGKGHIEEDDLIQECVIACVRKMRFYNPSRATAFNFFTTVCINCIKTCYSRESLPVRQINHQTVQMNEETTKHTLPVTSEQSQFQPIDFITYLKGLRHA